jgi:multiple sugar transport system permease protein
MRQTPWLRAKLKNRVSGPGEIKLRWQQSLLRGRDHFYFGLILPVIVLELAISVFPLVDTIVVSLTNESLRHANASFIGINNYLTAFSSSDFWAALGRTAIFVIAAVILRVVGGISIASLLNLKMTGRAIPRIAILIPWAISEVIVAGIWLWILDHQAGVINGFLFQLGIKPVAWLANPTLGMISVILVVFWKNIAFSFLLYLGALQKIPPELYDASKIDGANRRESLFNVTIPLLRPTIMLNIIMITISGFNSFSLVYALTGGGPLYTTELIGLYTYRQAFLNLNLGYAAALSTVILVINVCLTIVYYRTMKIQEYT